MQRLKRICAVAAGLAAVTAMSPWRAAGDAPPAPPASSERFDTIVLDAGHGGDDHGAEGARGLVEKELVLDVGRRMATRLRARSIDVVMTREDDRFVPLEERFAIANDARADLFVSIHANATDDPGVRGVETFFLAVKASDASAHAVSLRENLAFGDSAALATRNDPLRAILGDLIESDYMNESNEFARLAQQQLSRDAARRSRGVKQAPFVVLQGVQMPSSLVEIGFVTNPDEATRLNSSAERDRIADALVAAVEEFGRRFDARRGVDSATRGALGAGVGEHADAR